MKVTVDYAVPQSIILLSDVWHLFRLVVECIQLAIQTCWNYSNVKQITLAPLVFGMTIIVDFRTIVGSADARLFLFWNQILWRGQEAMAETLKTEEWDKKAGIRVVERPATYGSGDTGLG